MKCLDKTQTKDPLLTTCLYIFIPPWLIFDSRTTTPWTTTPPPPENYHPNNYPQDNYSLGQLTPGQLYSYPEAHADSFYEMKRKTAKLANSLKKWCSSSYESEIISKSHGNLF